MRIYECMYKVVPIRDLMSTVKTENHDILMRIFNNEDIENLLHMYRYMFIEVYMYFHVWKCI
jgi:hypothetical protein